MSVEPAPEEHFGPYLVYERLGIGGMATVHRALEHSDEGEPRIIALKRLLPHLAEDASFIKAFVREAKLASLLNHLNIVQIYELGRVGTEYFISMEYIDGRDLRRLLRHARKVTGPPPIYVTVGLMLQLCDALDYAHSRVDDDGRPLGLVHRDISPSNLIVTSGGQLKIIDFGIAKAQSNHLRTQTGRVKGKLAYMAPEAVSGSRDLDARSDIWAAGVILHEMITARPLFASKNEYQTLLKVQKGDILPPSTFNQACPPELDAIVFRALARDPDDRFATAGELRDELIALKRQYALKTGFAELAGWVDWAFGLEPPGGFSGDTSGVVGANTSVHAKTPRPPRDSEEDEAVEVVWGSGMQEDGPLVLEEVPDVSGKVRSKRDTDEHVMDGDDIPTPLPSHGTMPSVYGKANDSLRLSQPDPKLFGAEAALAASNEKIVEKRTSKTTVPQVPMPARSKLSSGQPMNRPAPIEAPTVDQRTKRPTAPGILDAPQLNDRMAAQRERESRDSDGAAFEGATVLEQAGNAHDTAHEMEQANTTAEPYSPAEVFGDDAAKVLGGIAANIEAASTSASMNAFREEQTTSPEAKRAHSTTQVPVVRFSKSHSIPPPPLSEVVMGGLDSSNRVIHTKPGIGPAPGSAPLVMRPPASTSRPPPSSSHAPANKPVNIIAPQSSSKKIILFFAVGVLLAGGTATLVAMSMSGGDPTKESAIDPKKDSPAGGTSTPEKAEPGSAAEPAIAGAGKVKFDLEPAEAAISIDGKPVHSGSPWTTELAAGTYPIEITKAGYKSWRTSVELSANETAILRVVLEPVTTTTDATLIVDTTPPGLDVYIDGTKLDGKTPIKTTMKVGGHKIVVKQNGAEVWQQSVTAEASSDYEFHPSFTDAKKRERAQRTTPRPTPAAGSGAAPVDPAPPTTTPSDTGTPATTTPPSGTTTTPAAGSGSASAATTTDKPASSLDTPVERKPATTTILK